MPKELDTVALTRDIPANGLKAGDVGAVVHVHPDGQTYEIEFVSLDGETLALLTLTAGDIRPVAKREIAHARAVA